MSEADRWVLSQTLADEHSEDVSREEVADLARYLAGDITADEYELRAAWRQLGAETVQLDRGAVGPLRLDTVA
ncbi:hypothetical protein FCG67_10805 [Rhodococcus oryzae]|uniref:Uncharacterized protein n=1 Tax=Rhodococcus oryzae TaxID=2571143 RepID=A0ABY2RL88_9NOCA|nr:hypothetical protein [Rhodococcus oryzae]TJZ78512.1 hypothetical protein FCG67_10805 [Rhodococcus oryzae]